MLKLRLLVVAALVAVACTSSSPYQLKLKPYELVGTDFPLPSGLRVFFQEDHQAKSVMVVTTVGVGAAKDPVGMEGMAHLVEHLNFRAKPSDKVKVWDRLQLLGAKFNAYTSKDITHYHSVVAREYLPSLLEIEARRLVNAVAGVTAEELKTEREVVRNELRQRAEDPASAAVWDRLNAMIYPPDHPYHDSIIGTHESLLNVKIEDVQSWVNKYYRPDNATIVVTGDFDAKEAGKLLAKAFPPELLAAPGKEKEPIEPVQPQVRISGPSSEPPPPHISSVQKMKGPVNNTEIWLGWSLPGAYRGDDWMQAITAFNLQSAIMGILYPKTEFDEELVAGLSCGTDDRVHSTMAYCVIVLFEGEDPEATARTAVDGIWELWDQQIHEWRKRDLGYASTYFMINTFAESASLWRASSIANYMHFTGQPDFFSEMIRELGNIKELDARDFAFKYLNRDRAVTLIVEPFTGDEREASMQYQTAGEWYGTTEEENPEVTAAFAKMSDEEIEKTAITPDFSTIRELTLPNGMRVVLKKHGSAPFAKVLLEARGGYRNSLPLFLPDLLMRQDRAQDPLKVAARWTSMRNPQSSMHGVEGPSGNLEALIDLLASRIETSFVRWEVVPYKNRLKREKKREATEHKDPSNKMFSEVRKVLFGDHPIARNDYNFDVMARLKKKHFEQWLHRTLAPANSALYVVGDIDLDNAEKLVRERWSRWRRGSPGVPMSFMPLPTTTPDRQIVMIDKPERTQADIYVECRLPPESPRHSETAGVLQVVLSTDLFRAVRETAGASYGVHVSPLAWQGGTSALAMSSNVQNALVAPALKTILGRLTELSRGEVSLAALNKAKVKIARQTRTDFLSIDDVLYWMRWNDQMGHPLKGEMEAPKRLASINKDDIAEVLKPCVGHEVIGIVGPLSALEEPIRELGIPLKIGEKLKEKPAEKAE